MGQGPLGRENRRPRAAPAPAGELRTPPPTPVRPLLIPLDPSPVSRLTGGVAGLRTCGGRPLDGPGPNRLTGPRADSGRAPPSGGVCGGVTVSWSPGPERSYVGWEPHVPVSPLPGRPPLPSPAGLPRRPAGFLDARTGPPPAPLLPADLPRPPVLSSVTGPRRPENWVTGWQ